MAIKLSSSIGRSQYMLANQIEQYHVCIYHTHSHISQEFCAKF